MKDSFSDSSSRLSRSRFPTLSAADTYDQYRISDEEDDVLSSIRSSVYSKKASHSSKKSKPSKSSRQSMMRKDERDDYSDRVFRNAATGERKDPARMVASSTDSKCSAAKSDVSPIPRDLVIKSRPSMSSRSSSKIKSTENDLEYWSALSVRAAMAVLKAGGSEKIAQEASNLVLTTGKKLKGKQNDNKTLMFLSTKLALVVLEAGGNEKVAAAVSSAIMASYAVVGTNEDEIHGSDSSSGSFHIESKQHSKAQARADAPSVASSMASRRRKLKAKEIEMEEKMKSLARADAPSVTSSMASRRRKLKAKEIEMEEKIKTLETAERRMKKEEDINEKLAALRGKDREEVMTQQQRLKELEMELSERKRDLRRQEEDRLRKQKDMEQMNTAITEKELDVNARLIVDRRKKLQEKEDEIQLKLKMLEINKKEVEQMTDIFSAREREINNKLEAIRLGEEERRRKEKEIEEKVKYFAQKEQEMLERLAAIEAASLARRKREREVEEKVVDFAQREKEIKAKLAAIDEASVARRKKEKEIEDKIMNFVRIEQKIDERLESIESASVLGHKEMEKEERLRLMELDKKELLIREKNDALEEAMQLNIQRENEIRERMAALDAATNALLERANAVHVMRDSGGNNASVNSGVYKQNIPETEEEDWCPEVKNLKAVAGKPKVENTKSTGLGFFDSFSKAFDFANTQSIAKAFDSLTCSTSNSVDLYKKPREISFAPGAFSDDEYDSSAEKWKKSNPTSNFLAPNLSKSLPGSQQYNHQDSISSEESTEESFLSEPDSFTQQNNKPINESLNQALKASMQLYSPQGRGVEMSPPKTSLKIVSANPHRNRPSSFSQQESQVNSNKGGLKNKLISVLRRKKASPGKVSKGYQVTYQL
ncbi:hypothetical protein ACHAXM_011882 [Skeletonema potamos]